MTVYYSAYITASVLLVITLAYVLLATSLERQDRHEVLDELAEMSVLHRSGGLAAVRDVLAAQEASGNAERVTVRVLGPDGRAVFVWRPPHLGGLPIDKLRDLPPAPVGEWHRLIVPGDGPARTTLELTSTELPDGTRVEVGGSPDDRDDVLRRFRRIGLLTVAVVLVLGVSGGALIATSALRPIRELVGAMRAAAAGEMGTRVAPRQNGDELDELILLFNDMLGRIAALVDGMRGAVDNVAHELRTPIMRMRGTAELALGVTDPERLRHAVAECVEELDQLLAMLNTVMDISEAEAGALTLRREPVDVAMVVAEMIELYQLVAQDKGITLTVTAPAGLTLTADRNRLRQVIGNLVDNAVKYTPAGGRVDVRVIRHGVGALVEVADTGRGIPAHELPRIWDRLYRGQGSRDEPGLGLGLSLVRAIVHAHGGRVDVSSTEGAGSRFAVVLPGDAARPASRRGAGHLSQV